MDQRRHSRRTGRLWALLVLALGYRILWQYVPTLSGSHTLDGAISVLLGLYICSNPAANAIDVLFFERDGLGRAMSGWSGLGWVGLNLLVLLAGWTVILVGTTRLAHSGP